MNKGIKEETPLLKIEKAKDGNDTLIFNEKHLLSRYHPLKDIDRVIPADTTNKALILFSAALGYLPQKLKQSGVPREQLFIYEPKDMVQLGQAGLSLDNLPPWLETILLKGLRPEIVALPSFIKAWPDEFQEFQLLFQTALRHSLENIKVSSYFSKVWFINYCRNITRHNTLLAEQADRQHDFPVVVCAAGPSLASHHQTLADYRNRYFLLAVLSAANSLKAMNIKPDAVLLNDAGVGNILHGAGLDPDIPVLAHIYASSALLSCIPNPIIYYNTAQEINSPCFSLDQPSVSIDAGLTARKISQGPLIFCGLDLSYSRSQADHSPGYAFSQRARSRQTRLQPLTSQMTSYLRRTDLISGEHHWTQPHFQMIREIVEETFHNAHYLPGGIKLQNLHKINDLSLLSTLPKISESAIIKKLSHGHNINIALAVLENHLEQDKDQIFIREVLQKEGLNAVQSYYRKKVEKIYSSKREEI